MHKLNQVHSFVSPNLIIMKTRKQLDDLSFAVIGAAIEVHKQLGPGLLESVYHRCLKHELFHRGIRFRSELNVPILYKETVLDTELRCDLFVEEKLVLEVKAVDCIHPVHEAQLLTYMRLLNSPKGILINFNCTNIFKDGQKTMVNELYRELV